MSARKLAPAQVLARYPAHDDTIPGLLRSRCVSRSAHEVLRFESRSWQYTGIDAASSAMAAIVAAAGVKKGDRVALLSANSDLALVVFMGLAKAGAVFAPVNPALTDSELRYILDHSGARLIVAEPAQAGRARTLSAQLAARPAVLDLADAGHGESESGGVLAALARLAPSASADVAVAPLDPAIVIYTSGTTGLPKGVLHSHRNYVWAGEAFVERLHLQPEDRLLTMLPFFHINALFYSWGGALAAGGTLITAPGFSASRLWNLAVETGATEFNTLAAVGNILAKRPRGEFRPEHKIVKIYGGPISADMMKTFQEDFHIPDLIEGYGMSEIPGACNNPFDGVRKIGSIGKPARHPRLAGTFVEMKIVDDGGNTLPAGEKGEVWVKTPIVMLGYLNDPAQTHEAFADGWFRTGDIAWRDEDGYYYFVTRKKDIIRRRGENLSGAEIDKVLTSHPDVLEAAAIGVPAELGEEDVMAVLVARPGTQPSAAGVLDWCAQHLAAMKVPRYVVFIDAMPHSASQRVAKFKLKEDTMALLARAFDREKKAP